MTSEIETYGAILTSSFCKQLDLSSYCMDQYMDPLQLVDYHCNSNESNGYISKTIDQYIVPKF